MKRTNIIVDEELLEKARIATGEKTYSATVTKALEEIVRASKFDRAFAYIVEHNKNGAMLNREYVEMMWPESAARIWPEKKRASADEVRSPREKAKKRGPR
ncbi:MAG TPA: type II toxin-antitoxin system VapB family antitoxin [Thermoanaerobaculia bacterium]|nr:type II toxin-antitoxin system VapB family antitoxin [Thermoanaerobaculia bacterium]